MTSKILIFTFVITLAFSNFLSAQKAPVSPADNFFGQAVQEFNSGRKDKAVELYLKAYQHDKVVIDYESGNLFYYLIDTLVKAYNSKPAVSPQQLVNKQKILDKVSRDLKKLKKKVLEGNSLSKRAMDRKDKVIKKLENEIERLEEEIEKSEAEISKLNEALKREIHLKKVWRVRARKNNSD